MLGFCSKEQQEGQVRQAENQEGVRLQLEILLFSLSPCHYLPRLVSCTYALRTNVNILGSSPDLVQQHADRSVVTSRNIWSLISNMILALGRRLKKMYHTHTHT